MHALCVRVRVCMRVCVCVCAEWSLLARETRAGVALLSQALHLQTEFSPGRFSVTESFRCEPPQLGTSNTLLYFLPDRPVCVSKD